MSKLNVDFIGNKFAKNLALQANSLVGKNSGGIGALKPFIEVDEVGNITGYYISVFRGGDRKDPKNYSTYPVTNATLRRDEWKALDDAVLLEAKSVLNGVQDLIDKNLIFNLRNPMGTTVLEHHTVGGSMTAQLTMDGVTRGENNRPDYKYHYLPIPILHVDYEINARELEASRNMGNDLDTTDAQMAARAVAEGLENMLMTDTTYSYGEKGQDSRNSIYSYVNYPDRVAYSLGTPWDQLDFDSSTASGGKIIVSQVNEMMQQLANIHFRGPYVLYIPLNYQTIMDEDYKAEGDMTIRDRLLKLKGLSDVKVNETLASDNVLLVQMTTNVVRLVRGLGFTNVQWEVEGKMLTKYKVMTIQVPQIRSDYNGKTGILHASA